MLTILLKKYCSETLLKYYKSGGGDLRVLHGSSNLETEVNETTQFKKQLT
jgi:hypothetical protein